MELWSLATSNNKFQAKYRGEMKDKINITNKNNHYKNKIRRILVVGPLCLTAAKREKINIKYNLKEEFFFEINTIKNGSKINIGCKK